MVCCYAPTLQRSLTNPNLADEFYSQLEHVINQVKRRDELFVLGDLNAKVGSSAPDYSSVVGGFSKHRYNNANGERLVEFCETHNLVLCNTLFKHRMAHRSTWFADGLFNVNGKPVRNMSDFVMIIKSSQVLVTNARSYGGFVTRSDHHPVIADLRLSIQKIANNSVPSELCFTRYHMSTTDSASLFRQQLENSLPEFSNASPSDLDATWKEFISCIHDAAAQCFGKIIPGKRMVRSSNSTVNKLSIQQKELHEHIHAEPNKTIRQQLQGKRSQVLHQIGSILREEGDRKWQERADAIDARRPDPRSY